MTTKIGINGFGRIGRVFFRAAMRDKDFKKKFEISAVNDLTDSNNLAYLLKYDSVHGSFEGDVKPKKGSIVVDGEEIRVLSELDPAKLPWEEMGVDMVLESTGLFTKRTDAQKHIEAGAEKVILSAPAPDPDVTLVLGVNEDVYDPDKHNIVSMASCTTNCLAPMVKVLMDNFGFDRGFMTTCHAYTNDQKLLDLPHKKWRRGRAANLSIIPTTTGAAEATGIVIPEVSGKLTGMALRVPVSNGSITDLVALLESKTSADKINKAFEKASKKEMKGILQFTKDELVSIDIVDNPHSCVIDGLSTEVVGKEGDFAKVFGWYDNEWGYSKRLVDLFKYMMK